MRKNSYLTVILFFAISFTYFAQEGSIENEGYTLTEIILKDSVSAEDLLQRATVWAQKKHPQYEKINAVGGKSKIELDAEFKIKPKELNPPYDYSGKISMHVKIDIKSGKYRYTINKVKHIADNGRNSGGDITKEIAECGSLFLPEMTWKKIKAEAVKDVGRLAEDLKDAMSTPVKSNTEDW